MKRNWIAISAIGIVLSVRVYALFAEPHLTDGELFWKYLTFWAVALGLLILSAVVHRVMQ